MKKKYQYANTYSVSKYSKNLDPNDSEEILRLYNEMINSGDRYAIWHWHVFENNLMEEDPINLLDPLVISDEHFPEARSVAYFETTLWLRGSYSPNATNLLERIATLKKIVPSVPILSDKDEENQDSHTSMTRETKPPTSIWICQGKHDEVCPPRYARLLVSNLAQFNISYNARFVNAGHEDTDPIMEQCLKVIINEFYEQQVTGYY